MISDLCCGRGAWSQQPIDDYDAGGYTCVSGGLTAALFDMLETGDPSKQRVVMVLTDGIENACVSADNPSDDSAAIAVADSIKQQNITVYAVGFGDVAEDTLREMASTPSDEHFFVGSSVYDIFQLFSDICSELTSPDPPAPPSPPPLSAPPTLPPPMVDPLESTPP